MMHKLVPNAVRHIAVATSGGADSMALCLLAQEWASAHGVKLTSLIVDHGLRKESAEEVRRVQSWLETHHIDSEILPIKIDKTDASIQEQARDKRYDAMAEWCVAHSASHLLLGHHLDDQAETVLFRWLRGSGFHGLSGMAAKREWQRITLLRPLLNHTKQELESYLNERGQPWVEDPSNENTQFSRVRIRQFLQSQAGASQRLANIAQRLGTLRHQDETRMAGWLEQHSHVYNEGVVWVSTQIASQPHHDQLWLWSHLLSVVDGETELPRAGDVERLMADLPDGKKHSLHRCLIEPYERDGVDGWLLYREPAHFGSTEARRWDRRFEADSDVPEGCHVAPLGDAGWQQVKQEAAFLAHLPRSVWLATPAIWRLEAVAALPHIGYYAQNWSGAPVKLCFRPAKPLGITPFFAMNNRPTQE